MITNFLSNAAKYAPDKKEIRLDFKKVQGAIRVSVMDSGIGFGIGLYLCAEIVKSHKEKIWAESEFGKGSTFLFAPLSATNLFA